MKVLIAPDSFKGTISNFECAQALAEGWLSERSQDEVTLLPMADGGEGTLETIAAQALDAMRIDANVGTQASWLLLQDGTAVVELASLCGITLLSHLDPLNSSTFALGVVLNEVTVYPGVKRILICVGGSASTDGGVGALIALGALFVDKNGDSIAFGGIGLRDIVSIDLQKVPLAPVGGVVCLTDVNNPLLGVRGSARTFARQKGADAAQVLLLEAGLSHLFQMTGRNDFPGAGAAGGTPFGLNLAWDIEIESGSLLIADIIGLRLAIEESDIVITGEGKLDSQSYGGKVVGTVSQLARSANKEIRYCVGSSDLPLDSSTIALVDIAPTLEDAVNDPKKWLTKAGAELAKRESN